MRKLGSIFFVFAILFLFYTCSKKIAQQQSTVADSSSVINRVKATDSVAAAKSLKTTSSDFDFLHHLDWTYQPNIKTVLFYRERFELSTPIISLNDEATLKLGFDDLEGGVKNFYYTVVPCNADWTVNTLMNTFDFIDGFSEERIQQYEFSFNTFQQFTHYTLQIPNPNFRITKSGNYLLKIYTDGDEKELFITRRMMVSDIKAEITGRVNYASVVKYRQSHQEIDFTVQHQNIAINNPFEDVKVVITQNDRWDNAIRNLKPIFVKDNLLVYDYNMENIFPAGKEFRWFDFRSFKYRNEEVERMVNDNPNHVYLQSDPVRSYKRFFNEQDINGKFLIENKDGKNNHLEADYAHVHFYLPFSPPVTNGNFYLFGAFTNWNILDDFKMKYNAQTLTYEATPFLKQGFYDYEYVFVEDGKNEFDQGLIEGNYYETENNYTVYVYFRPFRGRYDELIAVQSFNSLGQ